MGQLTLEQQLEKLQGIIDSLKAENTALNTVNGELKAENLRLKSAAKLVEAELSASKTLVSELSEALEAATKSNKNAKPSATYKKTTYDIVHGITHDNKLYSPAEIAANADLFKKLVESGSSAVREQITD